ncbi:uncharacterized protein F54H12.2-like [Montipora foliosa]|uniref:uncharacterized protein F54H12.2-like n=1 Tax=Montipora foliosa TaxID=591990 RepID=UPI0035F1D082
MNGSPYQQKPPSRIPGFTPFLLRCRFARVSRGVSIVSSKWVAYEPVQMGSNPIEFVIKPLSDYIDINKTELPLVVKITKQDRSPTGDGKKYTLLNNALYSIIKEFTIEINQALLTEQSDTQAYNAYIKTLVNFTEQLKKACLTRARYYKDTAGQMD